MHEKQLARATLEDIIALCNKALDELHLEDIFCECGHSLKEHDPKNGCTNQSDPNRDPDYIDNKGICVCVEFYQV